MSKRFIKVGDTVEVLSGDDKKKQGIVLKKCGKERLIVQGINFKHKHKKKNQGEKGKIIKEETPICECKVMLVDPNNKTRSRRRRIRNAKGQQ